MRIENSFYSRVEQFNNRFYDNKEINENEEKVDFQKTLKKCIDDVNQKAVESDAATNDFVSGGETSIDQVMMKATEANLSLQFLTTTRDKLVEGYKELIKMSV